MTGERRVVARGRRGTLVLSTTRNLTSDEYTILAHELELALRTPRVPAAVLLDGAQFEAFIPAAPPSSRRQHGHRPRWAR